MIFLKQKTNDEEQGFKFALCQDMKVLKTQIPPVLKTTDSLWGWLELERHKCSQSCQANSGDWWLVCVFRNEFLSSLIFGNNDLNCLPASIGCLILSQKLIYLPDFSAILIIFELPLWSKLNSTLLCPGDPCTSLAFFNDKVTNNLRHQDFHSPG